MNERIRQLAEQSGIITEVWKTDSLGHGYKVPNYEAEKFAELIVKECVGCLSQEHENYKLLGSDYCDNMADGLEEAIELIKEHFGVEQ